MTDQASLPQRIGRYEIKSLLGAGAMGSVYLAEDPRIKRKLAIKLVKMDALRSEQDRRETLLRFEREAEISGLLNDPNIVTIYDLGESDHGPYLAMEYMAGQPLDALIKRGEAASMPIPQRLRILAGIASALDHAHTHGIVHRDVKPANVMLTEAGRPKLMDFGIAKREDAGLTQTGTFLGTPSYASPEQIKDGLSSPRSDIFSFGVLAFELLSGSLPFQGNSINTILYRIVNEPPVDLHPPVLGLVPEAWRRIFLKGLAKEPAERHATCAAFVRELLDAAVDATETERSEILGLLPQASPELSPIASLAIKTSALPLDPKATVVRRPKTRRGWLWGLGAGVVAAGVVAYIFLPKGGSVLIKTQPRGAHILKGGKVVGETPLPVLLSPGEQVTLEAPGYHPETRAFVAGAKEIDVTLRTRTTEERLVTEPEGATVVLDDRPLPGATPMTVSWELWRDHRLTFTLKGEDKGLALDFKPGEAPGGQTYRLQAQAQSAPPTAPGSVRFQATFPVRVKVDGKEAGEVRPGGSLSLAPGEHRLEISQPKVFMQRTLSIQVVPGAAKSVAMPEVVHLTVETFPRSGIITIDGQSTGVESDGTVSIPVVKGSHTVGIQGAPGTQRPVDLQADKTLKFKY